MANTYDFYKPDLSSEYPKVDGVLSIVTYLSALDHAYTAFRQRTDRTSEPKTGQQYSFSLDSVDYALFHSPYGKLAVKGHARMAYNDFLSDPSAPQYANIANRESILSLSQAASLVDKDVEKTFINAVKGCFEEKVDPAMACSRRLGNMYTGSLYGCLASLLSTVEPATLLNKRVSFFAFGGGSASSFWTARVKGDTSEIRAKLDLLDRLATMKVVPCQDFVDALALREKNHSRVSYTPEGLVENIWPGAYYLDSVDSMYRTKYLRAPVV